jgi:hypothetical protein
MEDWALSELEKLPPDTLYEIALKLDLNSLTTLCQTSRRMANICQDNLFWRQKLVADFGITTYLDRPSDLYRVMKTKLTKLESELVITMYNRDTDSTIYLDKGDRLTGTDHFTVEHHLRLGDVYTLPVIVEDLAINNIGTNPLVYCHVDNVDLYEDRADKHEIDFDYVFDVYNLEFENIIQFVGSNGYVVSGYEVTVG